MYKNRINIIIIHAIFNFLHWTRGYSISMVYIYIYLFIYINVYVQFGE